ncbi:50S ribosomal protein L18e [Sulfolobus acidocaldarius]|uniref:Large ribosomal subunit protein eL18 n=5 Tax=Sulfolobus acidocaldarius TaxID=2285 RepID=RL18E_SULAC|nr:50S ribosomal protein L18e [Sulfolobus acidocaldarius]P39474.1 RecName: Full=Large ribosomal subunit protein eL18; AltName: Full=50S ribosomal protein L18e; AltName: Full=HL29e [Sulfolobus acidocaldarius DSM 639]AGE70060.1 50S ribosomal protein L18e [Sulfolobus acidocaldarius N8]AGE72335.1 50S ribosomal protein L18e [Sulfolobus acidocaldarius Ron12/I]ALU29514.1 50S ribosomal protein L18e [Sulfolobus acidocaldarius]ALU32244.1 50S ribosomal protein L18e [Sulfolobus acidocaldarius]WCM34091.1 
MSRGSTNIMLRKLITSLKKQDKAIWVRVAEELEAPRRKRAYINIYKINRYSKANDIIVVPGKVLGVGNLDHPVTVVALSFSKPAKEKILRSGGKVMSLYKAIQELNDFKGKTVRLMKQ